MMNMLLHILVFTQETPVMYDNNVLKGMDCSIISKQTLSLSEKYVQRQVLLKQALADISNPSHPYHI